MKSQRKSKLKILIGGVLAVSALMCGCSAPKDVAYFQNAVPGESLAIVPVSMIKAEPGDRIMIVVKTKDPALSALFNLPVYSDKVDGMAAQRGENFTPVRGVPTSSDGLAAYTVSPEGTIEFPELGKLKIEGMTRQEIAGFIKGELMGRDLVKELTVTVEFLNTGINMMGEIEKPGRYEINKDALTLVEALSMAGDIKLTGRRDNVKVLRRDGDKMITYQVNMTDAKALMSSPAYYLQQDDVVYVEPNELQQRNTKVNGNNLMSTGFWLSVASLLATAVTTVGVFVVK